jgi:hypothetical protein
VGATSYEIDRQAAENEFAQIGSSVTNTFSDTTTSPDSAYLYRVRAVSASGVSSSSLSDLATTIELRSTLDAALGVLGFLTSAYTDPVLAGVVVKAVHVRELHDRVQ